jgi:Fic family protein
MQTFRHLDRHLGKVPAAVTRDIGAIDAAKGRQDLFKRQAPAALRTLTRAARVQSTEASNAIEGITAPHRRIEALVEEKTKPANRSEEEIAGYRKVLDTIHSNALDIPFKPSVLEQFHRDLYGFTSVPAGRFKVVPNQVTETRSDGSVTILFDPVSPADTPGAMDELHRRFDGAWNAGPHHRLLLAGSYVFDFLVIHPFQDGNGRMARLVTLLLLYMAGYEVGRYVSLEKLVDDSRDSYYESLNASTRDWHDSEHDIWPWLTYFTGILTAAYKELERRVGTLGTRGAKRELFLQFVRSTVQDTITFADVRQAAPGVSDDYIRKVLRELRDEGVLRAEGVGRGARWVRQTRNL